MVGFMFLVELNEMELRVSDCLSFYHPHMSVPCLTRYSDLETEIRSIKSDTDLEIRSLKNKHDAHLTFMNEEHARASAKVGKLVTDNL